MCGVPVSVPATQQMAFARLPGSGRQPGLHSWVPWNCNNNKDSSCLATTPVHSANRRLTKSPSYEKGLVACPSFSLRGRLLGLEHIYGPTTAISGDIYWWTPSLCSPSALLQVAQFSWKEASTIVWCPNFRSCCPGEHLYIAGLWWPLGHTLCSPKGLYIFAHFKTATWRSGFKSA